MTTEKAQQEAGVEGNGPQFHDPQLSPPPPQYVATERGTQPTENPSLPADLIQVEEQRAPAVPEKVVTPPARTPQMQMPPIVSEPEPQMVTPLSRLTATPTFIDCPYCNQRAQTNVTTDGTPMQHMAAGLCCLFCICAVCVPYMCHWFEDTNIYCSRCKNRVATIPHDGQIRVYQATESAMVATRYQ